VKKRLVVAVALACFIALSSTWAQTPQEIAKKAFASTALLLMENANGQMVALGSGFLVGDKQIATNYHVIEGASGGSVKLIGVSTKYRIEGIVAADPAHDLVILRVSIAGPKALTLSDSDKVQVGDTVYAVGNPLGLEGTFSQGIVSGVRAVGSDSLLQITSPISPGSSGGPVLNTTGQVIGVSVATFEGGQNLNFAIPINYLKMLMQNSSALKAFSASNAGPSSSSVSPKFEGTRDFFELVMTGTPQSVQAAIRKGADVNAVDKDGMTPLMWAAYNNRNPEVITTLLKAGADINATVSAGGTALMWAAQSNQNPEVITTLLKAGADINARNQSGLTALMYAAHKNENPEMIIALLKAGADAKAKDSAGRTAFDHAQDNEKLKGTDTYWKLSEARY